MQLSSLLLLSAFLAICSAFVPFYPGDEYKLRRRLVPRPLRRSSARRAFITTYSTGPKYFRRASEPVAEVEQPGEADVHVAVPDIQEPIPEIYLPAEDDVQYVEEPVAGHTDDVLVHLPEPGVHVTADDTAHSTTELPPHEEKIFIPDDSLKYEPEPVIPEKVVPEVPVVVPEAPIIVPEVPVVEQAVVYEPEKDLSVLYDYLYPMVLRKCLSSAMVSSKNADYGFQMKFIDHPLIQIAGLDTLEEIRRNMTGTPARRFGELPKMFSGCVFHFNEIDADLQEARDSLVLSYEEAENEEHFHLNNRFVIQYEKLFKKQYMMYVIIRRLYELLRNRVSVYKMMSEMEPHVDRYITYWNSKN